MTTPNLLPRWTNPASVTAFLLAIAGYATAFIVAIHPGFAPPTIVAALIPSAGVVVAALATIFVIVIHRKTVSAVSASGGTVVQLPTWTDAGSVLAYLTSIVSAVFAVVTGLHPGFTEPSVVVAILPSVAVLVAVVAQLVNLATHHAAVASAAYGGPFGTLVGEPLQASNPIVVELDGKILGQTIKSYLK